MVAHLATHFSARLERKTALTSLPLPPTYGHPQRWEENFLPVDLATFSSAKIRKICPRLTPIQLTVGAALSGARARDSRRREQAAPGLTWLTMGDYTVGGARCQDWISASQLGTTLT